MKDEGEGEPDMIEEDSDHCGAYSSILQHSSLHFIYVSMTMDQIYVRFVTGTYTCAETNIYLCVTKSKQTKQIVAVNNGETSYT